MAHPHDKFSAYLLHFVFPWPVSPFFGNSELCNSPSHSSSFFLPLHPCCLFPPTLPVSTAFIWEDPLLCLLSSISWPFCSGSLPWSETRSFLKPPPKRLSEFRLPRVFPYVASGSLQMASSHCQLCHSPHSAVSPASHGGRAAYIFQ